MQSGLVQRRGPSAYLISTLHHSTNAPAPRTRNAELMSILIHLGLDMHRRVGGGLMDICGLGMLVPRETSSDSKD